MYFTPRFELTASFSQLRESFYQHQKTSSKKLQDVLQFFFLMVNSAGNFFWQ